MFYSFNPITGKSSDGGLLQLSYKIKQMSLLAETENDYVKGVLLIAADNSIKVYPESAMNMVILFKFELKSVTLIIPLSFKANGIYLFTADKSTATLNGYYVQHKDGVSPKLTIQKISVCLSILRLIYCFFFVETLDH